MERRIVSLCPSLTQTICDLGLKTAVVGCTKFCVHPPDIHRMATLVGGTKDPDLDAIAALNPTAVLVNEEENKPEHIEALAQRWRVLRTFPRAPADVPAMLRAMGEFLDWRESHENAAREVEAAIAAIDGDRWSPFRFLYFIWQRPHMIAGRDTYISRLLESVGGTNAYEGTERYPAVELADFTAKGVDAVLLSSEPYPFRKRDARALREVWPTAPAIFKIDGQLMSWHGTYTVAALRGLMAWRHKKETAMISRFED